MTGVLKRGLIVFAAAAVFLGPPAWAAGDVARGKQIFRKCGVCHSLEPGRNKIGPSLSGVPGRKSGSAKGFRYSAAMKSAGVAWTGENLDRYLAAPKKFVPGNRMPFPGLKKEQDRADLIAYLTQVANGR